MDPHHGMTGPLASLFLSVGSPLQLTLPAGAGHAQYQSMLRGWKVGVWLLCDLPDSDKLIDWYAGTPCLIRYVFSGRLFVCRSEIIRSDGQQDGLLLLAYPQMIDTILL